MADVNVDIIIVSVATANGGMSAQIDNSDDNRRVGEVLWSIQSGAVAPTVDTLYKLYLIRQDGEAIAHSDNNEGTVKKAITAIPANAHYVGRIILTADANTDFQGSAIIRNMGKRYALAWFNEGGQTTHATGTNNHMRVNYLD